MRVEEYTYEPRGGARELFFARDTEILFEGPANTGKTRALCEYVLWLCLTYPGIRVLFVRQTRKALSESVLVTWEEKVLPGGTKHPCVVGRASRQNRHFYTFPWSTNIVDGKRYSGQSHIVLGGMDHPERLFSTEWDLVCIFEAHEVSFYAYQLFLRSIRNHHLPWQQIICDTNPSFEGHWLNQRALKGTMRRILARHEDNPACTEADLDALRRLVGPPRDRLYLGKWVSSEGMVWPQFEPSTHIIRASLGRRPDGTLWLTPTRGGQSCGDQPIEMKWTFGSQDWGFRVPGVLGIWGVDREKRMYLISEYYRRQETIDWWAERAVEAKKEFGLQAIVCDHDPGQIEKYNDRMGPIRERDGSRIAREADKHREAGLQQVRDALATNEDGVPMLFFVDGCQRYRDNSLADEGLPWCTTMEITSYIFAKTEDGKPIKDEPDKACHDHGCDMTRYAAMYNWRRDLSRAENEKDYPHGTWGYVLRHKQRWREMYGT